MSYAHIKPPADIPPGAIAFLRHRADRPERLSVYHASGKLSNTLATGESYDDVKAALESAGYSVDANGFIFNKG